MKTTLLLLATSLLALSTRGDPLPDLVPISAQIPSVVTAPPNPQVTVSFTVTNQGPGNAYGYWNDLLYLSTKPFFDYTAIYLDYQSGPGFLEPGDTYSHTFQLEVPVVQSGSYYLLLRANPYLYVAESDPNNNDLAVAFTFKCTPADLVPVSLIVPPGISGPPYPQVTIAWAVTNQGPGYAAGYWSDVLFFSSKPTLDWTAVQVSNMSESGPIPAGGVYWRTNTVRLPAVQSGTYYLIFKADQDNTLREPTNNNVLVVKSTFKIQPPDLVPLALQAPNSLTGAPNPSLTLVWGVTNQGLGPAIGNYNWVDRVYLSTDTNLDTSDNAFANSYEYGPVAPGESYWRTNTFVLPVVESGEYYLIFQTAAPGGLYESDTNNNLLVVPLAATILKPDLVPITRLPSEITGPPFPSVTLVYGATNQGVGPALGSWSDYLFFATNASAALQGSGFSYWHPGPVPSGASYWQTNTIQLPVVQDGTYYLTVFSDYYSALHEADRSNNLVTVPIKIHILPPDLAPIALKVPNVVTSPPNPELIFAWGITNQGTGPAIGNWYWSDILYFSSNSVWDNTAQTLNSDYTQGPIKAGTAYWRTNTLRVPVVQSGRYYFFLKADAYDYVYESTKQNNQLVVAVDFVIQPPDLVPLVSKIPRSFTGPPYPDVTLVWGVTNQGIGVAKGLGSSWYDAVYLSADPVLDSQDNRLDSYISAGPLAVGASQWHTNILRVPVTQSGTYYLLFKADNWDSVYESDENNNIASIPVTFTVLPPDLTPLGLPIPAELTGPPNPTLAVVWGVTNQGVGTALPNSWSWSDTIYFSGDATLDSSDLAMGSLSEIGPVEPGETYWRTNVVHVPAVRSMNCYLIFKTDASDSVFESNEANNTLAVPLKVNVLPPDLAPVAFLAPYAVTSPPRPTVTFVWGVTNQGTGEADPGSNWAWYDSIRISTNSILDDTAAFVYSSTETRRLPAGRSYWRTNSCTLPVLTGGSYYFFFTADSSRTLYESTFTNNTVSLPINFTIEPPDLAPLNLVISSNFTAPPNPNINVAWGVTNLGPGYAAGYWSDLLYFSSKPVLDSSAVNICYQSETGPILAGERYWRTNVVSLPVVESGSYFLLFKADQGNSLCETQTENNLLAVPFTVTIQKPDLVPLTRLPTEITSPPYPIVSLVYGATNQGVGAALGSWSDFLFFATNADAGAQGPCFMGWHSGPVRPGGAYWLTNSVRLPAAQDGTYYFTIASDFYSNLYESDRRNNLLTVPVTIHIQPPDLVPISLQLPTVITSPPNPELTFVWGITNQGVGSAIGNWYWIDALYVSTSNVWDDTAIRLNSNSENGPVNAGDTYWRTNVLRIPILQSGRYYFFLQTDADNYLLESDEENNQLVVAVDFIIQPPDLVPIVSKIPSTFTGPPNPRLTLVWGVTNQGNGLAKGGSWGWPDAVYLSTDAVLDNQDSNLSSFANGGTLAPGATYWQTNTVIVPVTQTGTYYLIFKADNWDYVYESDENNNTAIVPVTFTVLPPDLAPVALQVPTELVGPPNPNLSVIWGVTNQGVGPALPLNYSWSDSLYLSRDTTLDPYDSVVGSFYESGPVQPRESYWRTNVVQVPAVRSTNCYLIFKTDSSDSVFESSEANNTMAIPLKVTILPPDLAPVSFLAPTAVTSPPLPILTFTWGVTNQGTGLADPGNYMSWYDRIQISTSSLLDDTTLNIGTSSETKPVPAGGSYWRTNTYIVPVTESGTYYLFFTTDSSQSLFESTFANNTVSIPITFTIQPPDLAVLDFQAPPVISGPPKPPVTLVWGVTNRGTGAAIRTWTDSVYFSSKPEFDYSAVLMCDFSEGGVEAGASYWRTNTCKLPATQDGQYYLFFYTDRGNSVYESDLSNNLKGVPVTVNILPPDLAPIALEVTNLVIGPPKPSVTFVWGVTNQGSGAAIGDWSWNDQLSLCSEADPDSGCTPFSSSSESGTIPPGGTYWRTNTLHVPVTESGTYYLRFDTDVYDALYESCFTNNQIVVPVTFQIQPPDLAPIVLQAPRVVEGPPYPQIKLSWGVTNQGAGLALGDGFWADAIYFSRQPVFDYSGSAVVWRWEYGAVPAGANYWRSQTVTLPAAESGNYYLIFRIDVNQMLYDANYSNNTVVVPITLNINPPDLVPLALLAPTNINGPQITNVTFAWAVTNQGTGSIVSSASWWDSVKLSPTPDGSWSEQLVFSTPVQESIPPGGIYWRTNTVALPPIQSGDYYFIFRTDEGGALAESDENNNTLAVPVTINLELPDLRPIVFAIPNVISGSPNPFVTMVCAITNQGAGPAWTRSQFFDRVFISQKNVLDGSESLLNWAYEQGPVPADSSYWRTNTIQLPVTQSGSYYLLLKADADNDLNESNETNNVLAIPLTLNIQPSDVAALGLLEPRELTASPYSKMTLIWGVTNQGPGEAIAGWNWRQAVYLSTNPVLDAETYYLVSFEPTNNLPPGATEWFTNEVTLPMMTDGLYYLMVSANVNNGLFEVDTTNDVVVLPLHYSLILPDLAPLPLSLPATLTVPPNPWISVAWGVTNQGLGSATLPVGWYPAYWSDSLWLSTSSNLDSTAIFVRSIDETNSVAPGQTYWRTNIVQLPVAQSGTYYLIFGANSYHALAESDFSNNIVVVPVSFTVAAPDLKPLVFQAPTLVTGQPNPEVTVIWGVTNQGIGPAQVPYIAPGDWWTYPLVDALYLSPTPTLDGSWSAQTAALWQRTNPIPAGASYGQTNTLRLPISNSGNYYLIFRTDAFGVVTESDESNNNLVIPVTFNLSPPADLTALSFVVPRTITGSGNPSVSVAWHVMNQGLGPTAGGWWDMINLGSPNYSEVPVASFWVNQYLLPGDGYWLTNTLILPLNYSGDYQLTLHVGTGFGLFDLDTQDNLVTVPFTLNIVPPPPVILADPQALANGVFRLSVYGALGSYYTLQASSDLQHWFHVLDFACSENPTMVYDLAASRYAQRFYRVVPLTN